LSELPPCVMCNKPANVALDVFDSDGNPITVHLCRSHWLAFVKRLEDEARRSNEVLAIVWDGKRLRLKKAVKPKPVRVPAGPTL